MMGHAIRLYLFAPMRFTGIAILALILYLLAAATLLLRLTRKGPGIVHAGRGFIGSAGLAAILLHSIALYALIFMPRGMNLGFFNTTSLVGWLVAVIALASLARPKFENLGLLLFPLAGISILLAELYPGDRLMVLDTDWPLDAHIILSLIAYSLFAVAALQAILIALQDYRLRQRTPGVWWNTLPSLQEMERFLFQLIAAGFVLLTLALFTGFIFVTNLQTQHLVHKAVLSVAAWIVFGVLLWGRWRSGWRGRTAIRWTLFGYIVLMLAYFGSKLVLELILGRHWFIAS
ncbi:MAG TPA: cytochrome c biogenesis protein CcsA [Gammaproteobacteria bacterium]|nr:cytochrome c biogenesis protein CcsA [Gammaproteobacteria bacterium]